MWSIINGVVGVDRYTYQATKKSPPLRRGGVGQGTHRVWRISACKSFSTGKVVHRGLTFAHRHASLYKPSRSISCSTSSSIQISPHALHTFAVMFWKRYIWLSLITSWVIVVASNVLPQTAQRWLLDGVVMVALPPLCCPPACVSPVPGQSL